MGSQRGRLHIQGQTVIEAAGRSWRAQFPIKLIHYLHRTKHAPRSEAPIQASREGTVRLRVDHTRMTNFKGAPLDPLPQIRQFLLDYHSITDSEHKYSPYIELFQRPGTMHVGAQQLLPPGRSCACLHRRCAPPRPPTAQLTVLRDTIAPSSKPLDLLPTPLQSSVGICRPRRQPDAVTCRSASTSTAGTPSGPQQPGRQARPICAHIGIPARLPCAKQSCQSCTVCSPTAYVVVPL